MTQSAQKLKQVSSWLSAVEMALRIIGRRRNPEKINIPKIKLIIYYSPISKQLIEKFNIPVFGLSNFLKNGDKVNTKTTPNNIATIIYTNDKDPKGIIIKHKNI